VSTLRVEPTLLSLARRGRHELVDGDGSRSPKSDAPSQPPPPANQAARSIGECGSSRGATGGGFVAVPVGLVETTPTRTTVHSPSREVAIQLASGSDTCLRLASAIASSRVIGFSIVTACRPVQIARRSGAPARRRGIAGSPLSARQSERSSVARVRDDHRGEAQVPCLPHSRFDVNLESPRPRSPEPRHDLSASDALASAGGGRCAAMCGGAAIDEPARTPAGR
jgi:hypothetical protein